MIEGIHIQPLKIYQDERGQVLHMLRKDDPTFSQFGEVYFSTVNPGVVKGWKKHLRMTQHFAVPVGNIQLVIYDDRPHSSTFNVCESMSLGLKNYQRIKIPPLLWYSFASLDNHPAMIVNCTDIPHDPQEVVTKPLEDPTFPYSWKTFL
ncbi:MAG: dTDP-4-dehydrorhamnose 3,5-epimerase family protein [Candidatus Omnitrophica bacterium]|nr:dTDP-4-dehydrorhamnose 3,5-epimerase family protein [Candidatus Omnitrophota bacterium]